MRTSAGHCAEAKYWRRQGSISQIGICAAGLCGFVVRRERGTAECRNGQDRRFHRHGQCDGAQQIRRGGWLEAVPWTSMRSAGQESRPPSCVTFGFHDSILKSHALLADEIRARRVLDRRPRRGERPHHAVVRRAQLSGAQLHARSDAGRRSRVLLPLELSRARDRRRRPKCPRRRIRTPRNSTRRARTSTRRPRARRRAGSTST